MTPAPPQLDAGEIHLWHVPLNVPDRHPDRLRTLLSVDENQRADRFVDAAASRRFVVARAALRQILGAYLERPPAAVTFRYGPHGKPHLEEPEPLRFNLSHAEDRALIAIASNLPVGVDIEPVRARTRTDAIARRFFSPAEQQALAALPEPQRRRAFFACWTRKEAVVKALGLPLAATLRQFDVRIDPDRPAAVTGMHIAGVDKQWMLHDVPGPATWQAAVAAPGAEMAVKQFQWRQPEGDPTVPAGGEAQPATTQEHES